MPKSQAQYMKDLDDINEILHNMKGEWEDATRNYYTLLGQYELIEGRIYRRLDIAASAKEGAAKRLAKVEAEEDHNELWTHLNLAKATMEGYEKAYRINDIIRSNIQSNLKAMPKE